MICMAKNIKKKGDISLPGGTVAIILLVILSFIIISQTTSYAASKADDPSAELLCRSSVAAREKTRIDFGPINWKVSPFLCRTLKEEFPKKKGGSSEDVKLDFAKKAERCWWMFGEGTVKSLFDGEPGGKNECFVCYTVKTDQWSGEKKEIKSDELLSFFVNTPKVVEDSSDNCKNNQGFCIDGTDSSSCKTYLETLRKGDIDAATLSVEKDNPACKEKYVATIEKKGFTNCCYSNNFCEGQGGSCINTDQSCDSLEQGKYVQYLSWSCPASKKCCVKKENYETYLDYIQSAGGGQGNLIITDNIKPNEFYAITFGSPFQGCGTLCMVTGGLAGTALGGLTAWGVGIALAPVTGGLSLVAAAGVSGLVVGSVAGVSVAYGTKEGVDLYRELYNKRPVSTIYITSYEQIKDNCAYIEKSIDKR